VVIDCTPSDVGLQNKRRIYEKYADNTLGFIAQGSEFGFGKMYARESTTASCGIGEDQFIPVVSCNTHNLSVLIDLIGLPRGPRELRRGAVHLPEARERHQPGHLVRASPRSIVTRTSASGPTMPGTRGTCSTRWATTSICSRRP